MIMGNVKQEEYKALLYKEQMKYEEKINIIKEHIQQINDDIANNCKQKYGKHDFEQEIEPGPYGETYYYCTKCGYEN